jgi:hypothetical protein
MEGKMKKIISLLLIAVLTLSSLTLAFAETDEPSSWSEEAINEMKAYNEFRQEAFNGYKDGITRLEFIYLAVRTYELLDGKEIVVDPAIKFNDTDDIYALKGATIGLTSGVGNGNFGTGGLDREQLATFMVRILTLLELEMNEASGEKFADDENISSWAKDAIYLAKNNNIISGVGNNKVDPKGTASTEMAIVIANRILKNNGFTLDISKIQEAVNESSFADKYWDTAHKDEVVVDIFEEASKVNKTYLAGGVMLVGADTILNSGELTIYTGTIGQVEIQVKNIGGAGVRSTLEGENIPAGYPVVVIRGDAYVMHVGVSQNDISKLREDTEVQVTLDQGSLSGRISTIDQVPNEETRTYQVEVFLDTEEAQLGAVGSVAFLLGQTQGIKIPIHTVFSGEEDFVYTVVEGVVIKKVVSLGPVDDKYVYVQGLEAGDQLIVRGMKRVKPGEFVSVMMPS